MFSVIFDMDGTLLDTQKTYIPAWEQSGLNQGKSGLGRHMPQVCGMNCEGWSRYVLDRYPDMDIDKFNEDVLKYVTDNMTVKFKEGAKELLEFLKDSGIKVGLASGSSEETVDHHLKEVGAKDYFDALVAGNEVACGKPAPDIFLLAAERLGVKPEDCFVFEDSANGIRAGYNANMKCIGVPDIVEFDDEVKKLLYAELKTLDEAINIFKKML